jgi:hypothetical protein
LTLPVAALAVLCQFPPRVPFIAMSTLNVLESTFAGVFDAVPPESANRAIGMRG